MKESIVTPFAPGSGRKRDYTWPDYNGNMTGAVGIVFRDRLGAGNSASGSSSPGTSGALTMGYVTGVTCCRLTNGANLNGGPVMTLDQGARLHFTTSKTNLKFNPNAAAVDDWACWSVYAIMRAAATPGDATDFGLEIVLGPNASNGVLRSAVPGWSIQIDNTGNSCSLVQHGNSGAQTATVLLGPAQGYVNTDWHKYEFRMLSATNTTDGIFKVLIDGVTLIQRSFGVVGDDLPLPSSAGANNNNGYVANIQAMSRNCELDVAIARSQSAPTEQALF
jgi:hypothetical protein